MSSSVNRVTLLGNLTRDPEIKYSQKGTAIAEFGMAMNRQWTSESGEKKEECTFVDITFWGRSAEVIGEYVKKGNKFFMEGRLQLDQWEDKQTGKKRQALRVIGESFTLLPQSEGKPKAEDRQDHSDSGRQSSPPPRKNTPPPHKQPPPDPDLDQDIDDGPF